MILITGGCGFIGSNFILAELASESRSLVNIDSLTYAGNLRNLASVASNPDYFFIKGDIGDRALVEKTLETYRPSAILNFAAESHVDRSIHGPGIFVQTNVLGTFTLLDAVLEYWRRLGGAEKNAFRFLHISTDEVYGSLETEDPPFTEEDAPMPLTAHIQLVRRRPTISYVLTIIRTGYLR